MVRSFSIITALGLLFLIWMVREMLRKYWNGNTVPLLMDVNIRSVPFISGGYVARPVRVSISVEEM